MLLDLNMEGFVLYVPNTRVKRDSVLYVLALGLKGRIRQSDIGVFPRRSCVLYVPSTRVQKIVACHMSLAQGLESRIRRSDIGVFPRRSCVLYVCNASLPVKGMADVIIMS